MKSDYLAIVLKTMKYNDEHIAHMQLSDKPACIFERTYDPLVDKHIMEGATITLTEAVYRKVREEFEKK